MYAGVRRARCYPENDRGHLSTRQDRARCGVTPDAEAPQLRVVVDDNTDADDDRETSDEDEARRRRTRNGPTAIGENHHRRIAIRCSLRINKKLILYHTIILHLRIYKTIIS